MGFEELPREIASRIEQICRDNVTSNSNCLGTSAYVLNLSSASIPAGKRLMFLSESKMSYLIKKYLKLAEDIRAGDLVTFRCAAAKGSMPILLHSAVRIDAQGNVFEQVSYGGSFKIVSVADIVNKYTNNNGNCTVANYRLRG